MCTEFVGKASTNIFKMKKQILFIIVLLLISAISQTSFAQNFTITNTYEWTDALRQIRNNGDNQTYTITVVGDVPVLGGETFGTVQNIQVTLIGNGTLSLHSNGSILNVGSNQILIIDDENLTLQGHNDNNDAVINLRRGVFELRNGTITGNSVRGNLQGSSVHIGNGSFIMQGGAIVNNHIIGGNSNGSVYVGGTFTMFGGTISDNTGGVVVSENGVFTMFDGNISNNSAGNELRGEVDINNDGTFFMFGGTINSSTGTAISLFNELGTFTLGGSPEIIGNISGFVGRQNVVAFGSNRLSPDTNNYTLILRGIVTAGDVALVGGAEFICYFILVNDGLALSIEEQYLIVVPITYHYVTTSVSPATGGTVSDGVANMKLGTCITVSAIPNDCYHFVSWTTNDIMVSGEQFFMFSIAEDVNLVANFRRLMLDFEIYVGVLWNNTFMINLRKLEEEGFGVLSVEWLKNGEVQTETNTGDQFSFSVGTNIDDVFEIWPTFYQFRIMTERCGVLYSTPMAFEFPADDYETSASSTLMIFPNPVISGGSITLDGVAKGSQIQIFNRAGMLVGTATATDTTTTLTINLPQGTYVIHVDNNTVQIFVTE